MKTHSQDVDTTSDDEVQESKGLESNKGKHCVPGGRVLRGRQFRVAHPTAVGLWTGLHTAAAPGLWI